MKLYIDNQTYIYMFEQDEKLLEKLESKIIKHNISIICSYTNLIEFSKSPKVEQIENLTRNMMKLKPAWIDDFITIQKIELKKMLSQQFNFIDKQSKNIIYPSFAQLLSSNSSELFIGATPLDFIKKSSKKIEIDGFNEKRIQLAHALNYLSNQEIKRAAKQPEIERKVLINYFKARLPITEKHSQITLIDFCLKNLSQIYRACPTIHAERLLSEYRTSSPKRKAKESDLDDLYFSVPAISYCDAIITNDGFLFNGLKSVKKKLHNNSCNIYRNIDEFCSACS